MFEITFSIIGISAFMLLISILDKLFVGGEDVEQ